MGGSGSIPGSGRSLGGGHGNPPQYFCHGQEEESHGQRSLESYFPAWGCKESDRTEQLTHITHRIHRVWYYLRFLGKDPDAGKDWGQEEKGMTEDEMVGWQHRLDGHEFEQAPRVGDGQEGLACCSPWGHKELDTTEPLN